MTARGPGSPTERDLRALLDADKVNNRQMGLMQFVEAHPLPAAQPQGELVPITEDMNRLMVAYKNGEFGLEGGSETVEALSVAAFDAVESHGHDADSYMSGFCAAMYEQAKPFVWLALQPQAAQPQGEPVAWIIQWASTIPGMRGHREVVLIEPSLNPRAATVTPLYAEQPAPVAVVLPTPSPDPQVEARAKEIYDG